MSSYHSNTNSRIKKHHLLNPTHFLMNKYKTNDDMIFITSSSEVSMDYSPSVKKYFGRKVTLINKAGDPSRAVNQAKLFSNLEISHLYLLSTKLRSKGNKVISFLDYSDLTLSQLKRLVTSCTGKVSFFSGSSEKLIFKLAKLSMRNIQQLSFYWKYSSRIQFDSWDLKSLKCLEELKITAELDEQENMNDDYEAANLIRLAENIAKLPRLKTVSLNISDLKTPINLLVNFILTIANSDIENWLIDVALPINDEEDIALLEPVFAKINGLGIYLYPEGKYCGPEKVEKIIQNPSETHKILGIFVQEPLGLTEFQFQANIYQILKHCKSLQTLAIWSNEYQFFYQKQDSEPAEWAERLQSVHLYSPPENTLFLERSYLEEILEKVHKESKNIKTLSVFSSRHCVIQDKRNPFCSSQNYPLVCNQLTGIKSLEKVKVSLQTIHFQYLEKFLSSTPNLIILNLKLFHSRSSNYWDAGVPFAKLKNLKEIKITLNGFSDEGIWGDSFVHQVADLKNLEVLSIKMVNSWKMLLSKLCILLNNVVVLPRLKSLVLQTQIVKSHHINYEDAQDQSIYKSMIENLRQVIKFMVYVQKNIEYIHLMNFEDCDIDSIKYKR